MKIVCDGHNLNNSNTTLLRTIQMDMFYGTSRLLLKISLGIYFPFVKNGADEVLGTSPLRRYVSVFSLCCLWLNMLPVHFRIFLFVFFKRLLCAWLASTVVTTVSCCVVKHKKQTNISPNNISLYNKVLHNITCPRSSLAFQQDFKTFRGINWLYIV